MENGNEVSLTKVAVKKEVFNDEIKEFAETAMNELLGWYGYGSNNENRNNARTCRSHSGSNSSGPESPKFAEGCGWCGKSVNENTGLASAAAIYCSELCFSQSRRANFKKNKTCDWCRHVRHTVSYVDSQDGAAQLQFCSDKCLNQYKMHIFWRETRAHLELHPHGEESSSGTLITPDLWLNKCNSDVQTSPASSPKEDTAQISPMPLITVAHPSKLMSVPPPEVKRRKTAKKSRKKLSETFPTEMPEDLRVRHTPPNVDKCSSDDNEKKLPNLSFRNKIFDNLLPSPTLLVPYPIILPLPIPIPIPIPIPLNNKAKIIEFKEASSQTEESSQISTESKCGRPLRKRKSILEEKTKIFVKNKKTVHNGG